MTNETTTIQAVEKERHDFPASMQRDLVALLLYDKSSFVLLDTLKPEHFANPVHRDILKILCKFYQKYGRMPSLPEFAEEFSILLATTEGLPEEEYENEVERIIERGDEGDFEYVRDRVVSFAKDAELKNVIVKSAQILIREGTAEAVENIKKGVAKVEELGDSKSGKLDTVELSKVKAEEVEWFWHNRIPKGKFSLIVGDPCVAKSFFTMMLVAHATNGGDWIDCPHHPTEKGKAIILTAEDGLADTVVPRLLNHDANMTQVTAIQGTRAEAGYRGFNLAKDVQALEDLIIRLKDVRLIIIDPVSAYLGFGNNIDTHKDKDVRGVLSPVANLAEKHDVTIIGVLHLNKKTDISSIYRVMGSMAFVAAARSVWLIAKEKNENEDQSLRYFAPLKTNLSADVPETLAFKIEENMVVFKDTDRIPPTADELLAHKVNPPKEGVRESAKQFLRVILKGGPVGVIAIQKEAKENGISPATLQRAKDELGIESKRIDEGQTHKWVWQFPDKASEE